MVALLGLAALGACGGAAAPTPTPTSPPRDFGVIVMAHGGSPEWNRATEVAVAPLRDRYELEVAFGMADAVSLEDAVRKLEARGVQRIGVVRLFVSGESWLERTEQIVGLRPGAPRRAEAQVGAAVEPPHAIAPAAAPSGTHLAAPSEAHPAKPADAPPAAHLTAPGTGAPPAGRAHHHSMAFFRIESAASFALSQDGLVDEPAMGTILAERARALSADPSREDVLVLAHGPGDDEENARWLRKLSARADAIRETTPFRRVHVETLREDWPDKRAAAEQRIRAFVAAAAEDGGAAIVIPFRVQGFGPYTQVLEGLTYRADGVGLLPHAEVRAWIERQIRALESR